MTFELTAQQKEVIRFGVEETANLLVSAAAGAAKTSTIVEMTKHLKPRGPAFFLAFNKKIADELKEKLAGTSFEAKTLNSLGAGIWRQKLGKKLFLSTSKTYNLAKDFMEEHPDLADEIGENLSFILRSIAGLKGAGYVPDNYPTKNTRLMDDDSAWSSLDEEPTPNEWFAIRTIYTECLNKAFTGYIDFADQLLMPTVFHAPFPLCKLVVVDETQDLSALNHQMLQKLVGKRGRVIAVGDQAQAIYGFRGAHSEGMDAMRQFFDMETRELSCSFRCPKSIVEHVQWRFPTMTHWADNPTVGTIERQAIWNLTDIPPNSAIICRNNAPLFSLAIKFFKAGIYANFWGNDIGAGLDKILSSFGPQNMNQLDTIEALEQWYVKENRKARNPNVVNDKKDCLKYLIHSSDTLGSAREMLKKMLNARGTIQLMTGHKSKGHEFKEVYFLNEELLSDRDQDPNLRYVICTRSQDKLTYIHTDGLVK